MIKEDHFIACTTRVFEVSARRALITQIPPTRISPGPPPYTGDARGHTLAASDYSLVKEQLLLKSYADWP